MKLIIDRFEGDYAVCEVDGTRKIVDILRSQLPPEAVEGSVLNQVGENFILDEEQTSLRKKRIDKMLDSLWE